MVTSFSWFQSNIFLIETFKNSIFLSIYIKYNKNSQYGVDRQ